MKRYEIRVVIEEGCDEFWEQLRDDENAGIPAVLGPIAENVLQIFPEAIVQLVKFEDT